MDDTPIWDDIIAKIVARENAGSLLEYKRKDVEAIDNQNVQRPVRDEYGAFIYIIELMKSCNYDERLIQTKSPFKVKDAVFNNVFYDANK